MKQLGLLAGLTLALFMSVEPASAQTTYVGEVCFLAGSGQEEDDGALIQLGISDMGDEHYVVNGVELREGGVPDDDSELYNGNAEIVGGNVLMMIHAARDSDDETISGKFNVKISLSSFDGTLNGSTAVYNKETQEREIEYFEGVIEVVSCPD